MRQFKIVGVRSVVSIKVLTIAKYTEPVLRKLPRYVLFETAALYIVGVAAVCLLLMVDTLAVLARFIIQYEVGVRTSLQLLLYRLPYFLHLALPIAVVFAVLLALGRLAKDSELKAMYASGVPPRALLTPLILFGLAASLLGLVNNGLLEARGNAAYQALVDSFLYVRPPAEMRTNAAYQADGTIFFATSISAVAGSDAKLERVLVHTEDELIAAPHGTWDVAGEQWLLTSAEVSLPGEESRVLHDTLSVPFVVDIDASEFFTRVEELALDQLWRQRTLVRAAGGDTADLDYEFHSRVADSLSAVFFATIAATVALRIGSRAGGFAWTIVLMVAFWGMWTFSSLLYTAGSLGPITAAWLTPALSALLAVFFVSRVVRA